MIGIGHNDKQKAKVKVAAALLPPFDDSSSDDANVMGVGLNDTRNTNVKVAAELFSPFDVSSSDNANVMGSVATRRERQMGRLVKMQRWLPRD